MLDKIIIYLTEKIGDANKTSSKLVVKPKSNLDITTAIQFVNIKIIK